jgi:hypothetical protein
MIANRNPSQKHRLFNIGQPQTVLLGDLSQIIGELFFFDDEEAILICLDQSQIVKSLHEQTDSRPRCANHLGQLFVRNLKLDSDAAGVFLAHGTSKL